ncbi:MAG TPA: class I SAM-dependent methyltransferase [bacterium]
MSKLYENPKYYEIAFSFRNIPKETNIMENCINRFSKIPVKSILEVGCGNSPHMNELLKRGYRYTGIDLSRKMLEYSKKKVSGEFLTRVRFIKANMNNFALTKKVDFAFILLGSLYASNSSELYSHFASVAKCLRPGGLYLLDWCVNFDPLTNAKETWTMNKGDTVVKAAVTYTVINPVNQLYEEKIVLNVMDRGKKKRIIERERKIAVYPQEFLCLIKNMRRFKFIGWWNNWNLNQSLDQVLNINRPIIILRRI